MLFRSPEGGERGGSIVATGTPEEIAAVKDSLTGRFIAEDIQRTAGLSKNGKGGRRRLYG